MLRTFCRVFKNVLATLLFLGAVLVGYLNGELATAVGADTDENLQFFESKVRPALVEHCLDCHAAETEASGGLLLDSRDGWQTGGDSGQAIVPGKPGESLVSRAISYEDPDLQMPPDGRLPQDVIDAFNTWINAGATDPRAGVAITKGGPVGLPVERAQEHWAYRPIQQPALPLDGRLAAKGGSHIDYFINRKLEEHDLIPAAAAQPAVLVRRLFFDLLGLPPTPEQLAELGNIDSVAEYEQLVDRLLSSPRFGEQFARKWMDVARYAESITLRGFVLPEAWRYRDYLIAAYANDRPFNQMVREQLAGDLLEAENVDERSNQLIATAFLAMGNTNLEQQDKSQLEMDFIDEQLEVIGRSFLGQTIGCARCHDHKFDPIPTRDYYALAGIFRSAVALDHANVSMWIEQPLPLPATEAEPFAVAEQRIVEIDGQLTRLNKLLNQLKQNDGTVYLASDLPGVVVDERDASLIGKWTFSKTVTPFVGDGYRYAGSGRNTATFEPPSLEPGEYEVRISYTPHPNRAKNAQVVVFGADGEIAFSIDQQKTPSEDALWLSLGSHRFEKDGQAYVLVSSEGADGAVVIDAVQFLSSREVSERTNSADASQEVSQDRLARELKSDIKQLEDEKKQLQQTLAARPKFLTVVERLPPRDIPIHVRGDVHNLGEVVPRGFLTAISATHPRFSGASSGRREFAEWVGSDSNPLTARVYANRVWTWLMGRGIVATPNNFGTTGVEPTHPELLDWLAIELIRSNWSTKHLIRMIVLSDAYQRALVSGNDRTRYADPDNKLYWNGLSRRLPAESLRDAMLSVSGELDLAVGGSLIRPGTKADYDYRHESTRRSVYQPVLRNSLPDLFEAFDFADTSVSVGQRARSTVATQALVLLNHPWVAERAARATDILTESFQLDDQQAAATSLATAVKTLYLETLGREPVEEELSVCLEFLQEACDHPAERLIRLEEVVHGLLASLDFRYLE